MDQALWIATIIAHVAILATITYRGIRLPIFTLTIAAGLAESYYLFLVHRNGSHIAYYYAYYLCDIANVGLYFLTIRECSRRPRFNLIAFSMTIYLIPKFGSYVAMAMHHGQIAIMIHGLLRPLNLACLVCWAGLFAMYSEDVTYPMQGDFMEPIEELRKTEPVEPEPKPIEPIEPQPERTDPGAPTPRL